MSMAAEGVLKELIGRSVETRMADEIRADVEKKANVDLSGVRLFYNSDLLSQTGEMAFTKGNQIHMQQGAFSQGSSMGKKVLTHELNHVIQQGTGKVSGSGIVSDAAMETQADSGVGLNAEGFSMPSFAMSAVQGFFGFDKYRKKRYGREIERYTELLKKRYSGQLNAIEEGEMQELEMEHPKVVDLAQRQYNQSKKEELDKVSAGDTRFMTPAEMEWYRDQMDSAWATGKNGYNKNGKIAGILRRVEENDDYSNYFNLSKVAKLALATEEQNARLNTVDQINALNENDNVTSVHPSIRKAMQIMEKMGKAEEANQNPDQNLIDLGTASRNKGHAMDYNMMTKTMYSRTDEQDIKIGNFFAGEAAARDRKEFNAMNPLTRMFFRYKGQIQNADEAQDRNTAASDLLLKTMMLAQLGDTTYYNEDAGQEQDWELGMANLFARGARTAILTPTDRKGEKVTSKDLFANFLGGATKEQLKEKGIFSRTAATHGFQPEQPGEQRFWEKHGMLRGLKSILTAPFRSISGKAAGDTMIRHYGMDVAIGGIGNDGVTEGEDRPQMVMNDGRSGHMYMGVLTGNRKQKGTILMGAESDSPYHIGQTGHMHNAAAQAEDALNTGGVKSGLVGRKYNGRKINVSKQSNTNIMAVMQAIERLREIGGRQFGGAAQREAWEQSKTRRNALVEILSGKRLDADAFRTILEELGIDEQIIEQIMQARG